MGAIARAPVTLFGRRGQAAVETALEKLENGPLDRSCGEVEQPADPFRVPQSHPSTARVPVCYTRGRGDANGPPTPLQG